MSEFNTPKTSRWKVFRNDIFAILALIGIPLIIISIPLVIIVFTSSSEGDTPNTLSKTECEAKGSNYVWREGGSYEGEVYEPSCEEDNRTAYEKCMDLQATISNETGDEPGSCDSAGNNTPYTAHEPSYEELTQGGDGDSCSIKGNISYNTGEKIYHVPGDPYYDATSINESYGERWFCSEQEAQNAGWRRAMTY